MEECRLNDFDMGGKGKERAAEPFMAQDEDLSLAYEDDDEENADLSCEYLGRCSKVFLTSCR